MARKLRIQYPGAIYHVMNRGDRREPIFYCDGDRFLFLDTLAESCLKTGWQIHAWCLMNNHFHLVIETPQPDLVEGMRWLLSVYTNRFNRRKMEFGHLFSGRYKAIHVDGSGNGYLKSVCDYVHLNPVKAGLIPEEAPLHSYRWSSYPVYLKDPELRPPWLRVDRLLGEWGIPNDSPASRAQFAGLIERRRREEAPAGYTPKGWCLGSDEFRHELLLQVAEHASSWHRGEEVSESAVAKAERIAEAELRALRWTKAELQGFRKGDPRKVRIALRLRQETTMSLAWIASRLCMGAPTHVAYLLQRQKQQKIEKTMF